jgi:aspartyl-tRNA(Asn)/glutamyl-tRNA(Gln) amidotransferase subunit B
MEEGSMRCDANVSVMKKGSSEFGTKVEVKNMNSIRNVQRAIEFEVTRQIEALENGETLYQETRAFDALKGITISMRSKEAANDYRYFPEPDLQPLKIDINQINSIKADMPALPKELFDKYTKTLGLTTYDAYNLTDHKAIALFYEEVIKFTNNYKAAANIIMGEVKSYLNQLGIEIEDFPLSPEQLANLKTVLKKKVFKALVEFATENNDKAKNGYDILRGDDLFHFVKLVANGNVKID